MLALLTVAAAELSAPAVPPAATPDPVMPTPTPVPKRLYVPRRSTRWVSAGGQLLGGKPNGYGRAGGSFKGRWDRDVLLALPREIKHRMKLSALYDSARRPGGLDELHAAGSVGKVVYEASRSFSDGVDGTKLQLAARSNDQCTLVVEGRIRRHDPSSVESVGAVIEPGGLISAKLEPTLHLGRRHKALGLKIGRGTAEAAIEVPLDERGGIRYELGARRELGNGRRLRGRLCLHENQWSRNAWVELTDPSFEPGATWITKASLPFDGVTSLRGLRARCQLSLRRAWQW